jgi:hypothetical protein
MLQLPCMLVCRFVCANRTRDRGCSKHPVFPAPSISKRAKRRCKPRAMKAARSRNCIHPSLLRAQRLVRRSLGEGGSNPLSPHARKDGLLRFARNDVTRPQRASSTRRRVSTGCTFGGIKSIDLYKPRPIFFAGKDKGGRYADRRCQGVGACHALGAQF